MLKLGWRRFQLHQAGLLALLGALAASTSCRPAGVVPKSAAQPGRTVRVAAVHFAPELGNVSRNRSELVRLTEEAALGGAKIVVHTEMATTGYSFFSREEISRVAETVPGPTTEALGEVARRHGLYVVVGLPEKNPKTGLYYNTAALIGPRGEVVGKYHKRNHLFEASYNAAEFGPLPIFATPYGRLAILICSDLFYSQFPRLAALASADILLIPANVGISTDFLKLRAFEDQFALVLANRYGTEVRASPRRVFDQDSFTIPSPWAGNFNLGTRSVVMTRDGDVLAEHSDFRDAVIYGDLPLLPRSSLPVVRRPDLYSLIGQDTLEPFTFSQFPLPPAVVFAAAAVDPGPSDDPWTASVAALERALAEARSKGWTLRLAIFPQNYFPAVEKAGIRRLRDFAQGEGIDLVLGMTGVPPRSQLLTADGQSYSYDRTHRGRTEPIPPDRLSDHFFIIDRPYARLALLQDRDLFAPETSVVMAKMGVDVIAVGADSNEPVLSALWQSRTGDYLHLVVANRVSKEGIYLGGYRTNPSFMEADGLVVRLVDTQHVRNKKGPRFLDFLPLLQPCGTQNC